MILNAYRVMMEFLVFSGQILNLAPRRPVNSPASKARPRLEPGRQTRRSAKVGRVQPNHPAALHQGMAKGFDPPGPHNLPNIRYMTGICMAYAFSWTRLLQLHASWPAKSPKRAGTFQTWIFCGSFRSWRPKGHHINLLIKCC